jgi:hypothetical protein
MAITVIRVGHPSYQGTNRYASHTRYRDALRDLLQRGIRMRDAHRGLKSALGGSHATCPRYSRTKPHITLDSVEVCTAIIV